MVSQLYKLLVAGRWFPHLWFPQSNIKNMIYLKYRWKHLQNTKNSTLFVLTLLFLIFQGPKLCIEINEQFDTISQLVEHYKKHNLPNNSITLGQGYNEVAEVDSDDYEPVEKPLKWNLSKPNLLVTNFSVLYSVLFILVKLTKMSYIGPIFKV